MLIHCELMQIDCRVGVLLILLVTIVFAPRSRENCLSVPYIGATIAYQ